MESGGLAEKYQAVVKRGTELRTGRPKMGQGRACTMEAKALLVHPSYQGVCGRHGTEDDVVTHGDLVVSGK
ncbi:hypothetical protein GCM10025859_67630 [Alicyclobacillus fastidiosus]|nr:hypothetical protein GCM10025859_18290 [Alicyclobacillus fastidiosus]GMA62120.1 hypothetical protein GCM10025859_25600 [Alicyclobacillus fastidiosus]GMA64284.1 hypothetical protein GCM10025859_47240 [Alicyclobacillus fastidiosus]GMA66272.1 hypothetical protein GCM10025859_67140 [Alicyclobacillus fastidiosus]GMA66321.1 hypothetical protein GCM10025859_67630 [Alicyclobacillus fastidiosus]